MDAVGSQEADAQRRKAQQARERLELWQTECGLDSDTAQAVARAVLEPVEDAHNLAMRSGEVPDVDRSQEIRQTAAVTRYWLRDVKGYDIPDYEREPGL